MNLIVLSAPKKGGKDETFKILKENKICNGKLAIAGPLKDICTKIFNVPYQLFHDQDLKELPFKEPIKLTRRDINRVKWELLEYVNPDVPGQFYNINKAPIQGLENKLLHSPREMLQIIGTELIRDRVYKRWHCLAFVSDKHLKDKKINKNGTYAVTDCRFPNEYLEVSSIMGNKANFAYIERPIAEKELLLATHESELAVKEVRKLIEANGGPIIKNDGSLEDLKQNVLANLGGIYDRTDTKDKKGKNLRIRGDGN